MRKIGVNLYAKIGLEMADHVQFVKDLGFDAIFTSVRDMKEMHEVADLVAKAGLIYEAVHAPRKTASGADVNDLWYAGEAGDEMYAALIKGVDVCAEVGSPISVVHLSSGDDAPPPTDVGRGRFIDLVDYAAGKGVSIAFENTRKLFNLAWAFEEFRDADNVGFCYDSGHEACYTPGKEFLPIFGDRLICTHIHDNDGIKDLHHIPFDADIDFNRVARQIRECGYKGSLMLEVVGSRPYYDNVPACEYMERAASAVKRLREMVDGE